MKKIIANLAMIAIVGTSAIAGINEDASTAVVKKVYSQSKKDYSFTNQQAFFNAYGGGINSIIGTLNNNTQNLQLPGGTISINQTWASLFIKITEYINTADSEKEYYFRIYQYISSSVSKTKSLYEPFTSATIENSKNTQEIVTNMFNLLRSANRKTLKNGIKNVIIFASYVDRSTDNSFATKHFTKNGLIENWLEVRKKLDLK